MDPAVAERALAIGYTPVVGRSAVAALFDLDATLGQILRTTRDPLLAQMRLTWWFEALGRLDSAPPPAQPVLRALAADVLPTGVSGAQLADLVIGWEVLLEDRPDAGTVDAHGRERGGRLFGLASDLLGTSDDRVASAGSGWAAADLARHMTDPVLVAEARRRAGVELATALRGRWPRALRTLGAFAVLARDDLRAAADTPIPHGSPRRVLALLRMRLTGY